MHDGKMQDVEKDDLSSNEDLQEEKSRLPIYDIEEEENTCTKDTKENRSCHGNQQKWLCVLGCALAHFVLGGFERSNGVLFLHIQDRYGAGASDIAWVISLSVTLKLLFGPVASILCTKLAPRCVVMIGTVLFSLGVLLTANFLNFTLLFLSYGIIAGIGKSLAYQPGLVVVGQHFTKKRGIAVGLATAGGGIGTLILPPLFEVLLTIYGFSGGLLILSGVALQICVSGMLYGDPGLKKQEQPLRSSEDECIDKSPIETANMADLQVMEISDSNLKTTSKKRHKFWISKCFYSCHTIQERNHPKRKFNLVLLKKPEFFLFCLGIGLLALSFNSLLVFIPPLAHSRGLRGVEGAYIMSVAGVFDTVGRIASGFILEAKRLRMARKIIYNGVMFFLAIVIFSLPFVVTFIEFCVVAALFGLLIGTYTSQKSVILADIVGSEELNSSFGILIFFQGVGTLLGPPITGIFKDVYNSYEDGFYFIGGITFLGSFVLLLSNTIKSAKKHCT